MPSQRSTTTIPCPQDCNLVLRCKDCVPVLELYDITRRKPALIATFERPSKEMDLSISRKYRLILVNEDTAGAWSYDMTIVCKDSDPEKVLMSIQERGQGQTIIRRDVFFDVV